MTETSKEPVSVRDSAAREISAFQEKCIRSFRGDHALTIGDIAVRVGGIKYKAAVASAMRSLLRNGQQGMEVSPWVTRLPPHDQWCSEFWCLGPSSLRMATSAASPANKPERTIADEKEQPRD